MLIDFVDLPPQKTARLCYHALSSYICRLKPKLSLSGDVLMDQLFLSGWVDRVSPDSVRKMVLDVFIWFTVELCSLKPTSVIK